MGNVSFSVMNYLKLMQEKCENMDEKTCLTTYCEECMLEEFTKLVKENVYYYDDVLDFLQAFLHSQGQCFDDHAEKECRMKTNSGEHKTCDCLVCFSRKYQD